VTYSGYRSRNYKNKLVTALRGGLISLCLSILSALLAIMI
jgi:hypothetical protein